MSWSGRSIPRFEDPALITGRGRFVADLARGSAAIRFVRSPVACGTIIGVESPRTATVITATDLKGVRPIRPLLHRSGYVAVDQPILASERVTYVGEPIAAVVAGSAEEAEDIAEQVIVEIEPKTPIVDADAALTPGAPLVHDNVPGNVLVEGVIATAGLAAAFDRAAEVVEIEIRSHRQCATPLEARGAHAAFDPATGRVTLTASVQMPHMLRTGLADILSISEADLRVVAPDVGGAFGQKMSLVAEYVVVVWASRKLRRSLAWIEDRRENLMASFHSRDHHYFVRGAFDADGRLLAIDADLWCNVGAYSCYPVTCGVEPLMAMAEFPGPYDFREYSVRARGVATNTCPMAPYRGVSRPVITLAMERLMDCAAERFRIDPVQIRLRNVIDSFPYTSVTGLVYDEGSYRRSLEVAERTIDLNAFRQRQHAARAQGRYLGVGFAVFNERTGYGTSAFAARSMDITPGYERAELHMDPSGFVEARIGASPHGQGLATSLAQLIADELGVDPTRIRVIHGDTDRTPYGWGTFASRSMVISGGACKLAAAKLRSKLVAIAGQLLEAEAHDIVLENGKASVAGTDHSMNISAIARTAFHQTHRLGSDVDPTLSTTGTYDPQGTFSNACHVAVVDVDPETGQVTVERFLVVEDAGLLINPMIADGQIHGGVTQGIANAIYEEIVYDNEGNILTTSLADYLPPTASEVPAIEILHLQTVTEGSVTGAKGLGEGGAIGTPAAVINAVSDALCPFGVALFEMPATPERIRALIRSHEKDEQ